MSEDAAGRPSKRVKSMMFGDDPVVDEEMRLIVDKMFS